MATNNFFSYSGTQYAAASAAYQTQQSYAVPAAATGATTPASFNSQRTAYDPAYQTSATPVTYPVPTAVGVTYDSTKTYYQQAAPAAAVVAATTAQGAVNVGSTPDYQNWQQTNYSARQSNAATVAAAANKVGFCASYSPVPTTRQMAVPQVPPKIQTTNASPFVANQFSNQQATSATNYNYAATAQANAKVSSVGTIGQPAKKTMTQYQQKPTSTSSIVAASNASTVNNTNVTGSYHIGNSTQNNIMAASAYPSVPGNGYSSVNVGNNIYNANVAIRPKTNPGLGNTSAAGASTYSHPYDAALFTAAATMYMNQNPRAASKMGNNYKPRPGLGSNPKFKNFRAPKPQQLHYCDACKISCAGPSAYHDHLQGQKHKKKVAKTKPEQTKMGPGANLPLFVCELCDIECTAADAYAAHLRGAKHKKVVKLHTKLGKPIPPPDPKAAAAIAALTAQEEPVKGKENDMAPAVINAPAVTKSVTPRITFVSAGNNATSTMSTAVLNPSVKLEASFEEDRSNELPIDDRPAVGSEYIEEEKDASGKLISFNCKLCECKFSDPNAKEMHMKGRKHRLQFKKKVDPKLKVEMKPNNFKQKRNEKWKKQADKQKELVKRKDMRYEDESKDYFDWCRKTNAPNAPPFAGMLPQGMRHMMMRSSPRPLMMGPGCRLPVPPQLPQPMFVTGGPPMSAFSRKFETFEDRHIWNRHKAICPTETEVQHIQEVVENIEKALKLVSDHLVAEAEKKYAKEDGAIDSLSGTVPANVNESETNEEQENNDCAHEENKNDEAEPRGVVRELTGVLRIGIIAKGLLLTGDTQIDLVMMCSVKPTMSLLNKVVSILPSQLKDVAPDTDCVITPILADAAFLITTSPKEENEQVLTVQVTLTSTVIREEIMAIKEGTETKEGATDGAAGDGCKVSKEIIPDPPDVLNKTKCLEALAALRHAKWFQARVTRLQSCLIVIRILIDLRKRVPVWAQFNSWALELLCEKVYSSSNMNLSPGDGLRRVFESIASGLLLPDGPGLMDPCEKDPVDATRCLTPQQREDITCFAQYGLRLIAFRQIHKVLGMDPLPALPKFRNKQTNRKRRRENSAGGRNEGRSSCLNRW